MNIFITILAFYAGSCIGSFLSVVIHRIRSNKPGIILGRSACPSCSKPLLTLDLIPIVSYIALQGRCRYCQKAISPHYFFIEILTGITFAAIYLNFPFITFGSQVPYTEFHLAFAQEFIKYGLLSVTLLAIFFYDLLYKEIPDIFSYVGIAIAVIGNIFTGTPTLYEFAIGGAVGALFFLTQLVISKGTWVGSGDVILGMLMGITLGWKHLIIALFISYLIGTIISIWLLAAKKATRKTQIPFAPFLVTGTILTILFGDTLLNWYLSSILTA